MRRYGILVMLWPCIASTCLLALRTPVAESSGSPMALPLAKLGLIRAKVVRVTFAMSKSAWPDDTPIPDSQLTEFIVETLTNRGIPPAREADTGAIPTLHFSINFRPSRSFPTHRGEFSGCARVSQILPLFILDSLRAVEIESQNRKYAVSMTTYDSIMNTYDSIMTWLKTYAAREWQSHYPVIVWTPEDGCINGFVRRGNSIRVKNTIERLIDAFVRDYEAVHGATANLMEAP